MDPQERVYKYKYLFYLYIINIVYILGLYYYK